MITGAYTYTPDDNNYYYHTCRSIYSSFTRNIVVADSSFSSSNRISSLEHVVVTMTLGIVTGGTRYDYDDLYYSDGDIYEWLENPHPRRGDIKIELTSPSGTKSILLPYRNYDFVNEEGYDSWPFMSVHFWGENPSGTWRLKITYKSGSGYVRMTGVHMTLYGTATTPTSVSNIPSVCHSSCAQRCFGEGSIHCDSCRHYRIASTLECVNECPINTRAYKTYCFDDENPTTQTPSTPTSDPTTQTPSTPTSDPTTQTPSTPTSDPTTQTPSTPTSDPTTQTPSIPTSDPTTDETPSTPTPDPTTDETPSIPTSDPITDETPSTPTSDPITDETPSTPTSDPITDETPSIPNPDTTTDKIPSPSGSTNDIPSPSSKPHRDNSTADDSGGDTLNLGIAIGATVGVVAIIVLAVIIGIVAYIVYMRNRKVRPDGFVRFDVTQNEVET